MAGLVCSSRFRSSEIVLGIDVMFIIISEENQSGKGMDHQVPKHAEEHRAWNLSDVSHLFMVEAGARMMSGWKYQNELIHNDASEELFDSLWATVDVDEE